MHIPPLFAEAERDTLHHLIRAYPLATLVTTTAQGPEANLLPLQCVANGTQACLQGHIARTHPVRQSTPDGSPVLAVFQGPNAYISPRWYVNGQRSGRVAPSWNYVAVEVRGLIHFIDDSHWVWGHLESLTAQQESTRDRPWTLADASPEFVGDASRHLIGFEIEITHVAGKRFLSQQRTQADRLSLVHHLRREARGTAHDLAELIAP